MSLKPIQILSGQYSSRNRFTFVLAMMVLFLVMFDNIIAYISPLLIAQQGYTNTIIGLIIGSSSLAGAVFDFFISKYFKNTNWRRIFLLIFVICLFFPLLLWQANAIWFWLLVMALWGVYYDLLDFGIFDYVGRYTKYEAHADSFGILQVFKALAGILSPLIVGLVIIKFVDWRSFALAWIFLGLAFVFFIVLLLIYKKRPVIKAPTRQSKRLIWVEWRLWKKIGRKLMPVLILTFFLFMIDAFFWVLAPLYGTQVGLQHFGGLFLSAYALPILLLGWFVGPMTKRFGKKHSAFVSLLIGSAILASLAWLSSTIAVIVVIFLAACFISLSVPAINGAYADYISESPLFEGEIEGLENFAFNIGYFIGPILAGFLADVFDIKSAFSILGMMGVILSLILLKKTPQSININISSADLK